MIMNPIQVTACVRRGVLLSLTWTVAALFPLFFASNHVGVVNAQSAEPASPHDIADTWQGTLHAGRDLRTVVKITKGDNGGYKRLSDLIWNLFRGSFR